MSDEKETVDLVAVANEIRSLILSLNRKMEEAMGLGLTIKVRADDSIALLSSNNWSRVEGTKLSVSITQEIK